MSLPKFSLKPKIAPLQPEDVNPVKAIEQTSSLYQNKSNTDIDIPDKSVSLTFRHLTNCNIRAGPCQTSVFIEDCTSCIFQLAAHQIRASRLSDCKLFIYSPTGLIIEESKNFETHPYSYSYPLLSDHLKVKLFV